MKPKPAYRLLFIDRLGDLQRAVRVLHHSCGISYRRMRVHHEEAA